LLYTGLGWGPTSDIDEDFCFETFSENNTLDQSQYTYWNDSAAPFYGYILSYTNDHILEWLAQSFKPSMSPLTKVKIWLWKLWGENQPPGKPNTPVGPLSCKIKVEYTYTTSTNDINGHQIYYQWDWDDSSTSQWIGPYSSGEEINTTHVWNYKGIYHVRVKARDAWWNEESNWSNNLTVISIKPICGDVNGDDIIDISDAVNLIEYIFSGGVAPRPICAGDANGDGYVDISDAVYLISYIFSGGPPPGECCK
jgi:hypothetical protein